ncbi:MAG: hypothetical protein M8467_01155 [Anaerolineae bacterium]|nr:hypothetical protein [Anaerolineae bacterium]
MIPVEYLWFTLFLVFGIIGMVRGLLKELGVTTVLLLSLFVLKFTWDLLGEQGTAALAGRAPADTVLVFYYSITILFVAYISYQGFTLSFPIREMRGVAKAFLGFPGGLLNGYLIIGTVWDVLNQADYLGMDVPFGTSGAVEISQNLTQFHNSLAQFLPITFIDQYLMLVLGMILLVAILLR